MSAASNAARRLPEPPAARLGAVLFDLDGTLVDSTPALRRAYHSFLERHGRTGSDEEFERWAGPPLGEVVAGLAATHRIEAPLGELVDEYLVEAREQYLQAPLFSGVVPLLDQLAAAGVAVAVVTSAPASLARALLEARGILARFRAVVCGDEVAHGKPHPDGYREALRRLGLGPARAVAVEDTASGVHAARAAGLPCVAVGAAGGTAMRLACAGATLVAADIEEAARMIGSLSRGLDHATPASALVVRCLGTMAPLDEQTAARVDAIWAQAVAARPGLFDGRMLVVTARHPIDCGGAGAGPGAAGFGSSAGIGGFALDVMEAPYRWFFAQRQGVALGLRPLGVTGVTEIAAPIGSPTASRLLVGRRGLSVTQHPGCWELVPSGGVSTDHRGSDGVIDLEAQLREELEEELGVLADRVISIEPLGLIESASDGVVDAAFRIAVRATPEELDRGIARTHEYTALAIRSMEQLRDEMGREVKAWVPTVAPLVELLDGRRAGRPSTALGKSGS